MNTLRLQENNSLPFDPSKCEQLGTSLLLPKILQQFKKKNKTKKKILKIFDKLHYCDKCHPYIILNIKVLRTDISRALHQCYVSIRDLLMKEMF